MTKHWDVSKVHEWKAAEFPIGAVEIEAGNSVDYITGGWRAERPVWDADTCTSCMLCWVMCPDSSIIVKDGQMVGIDYDHCKGCGICVKECKFGALHMILESEAKEAK